jgi:phage-related minor tail protein
MANIKVRVGQKNAIKVTSSLAGASAGTIGELSDVNASNPQNGMVLVYNSTTGQWTATDELTPGATQNLDINGGSF